MSLTHNLDMPILEISGFENTEKSFPGRFFFYQVTDSLNEYKKRIAMD